MVLSGARPTRSVAFRSSQMKALLGAFGLADAAAAAAGAAGLKLSCRWPLFSRFSIFGGKCPNFPAPAADQSFEFVKKS